MAKRRDDPNLLRIILFIVLIGVVIFGIVRGSQWFEEHIVAGIEAEAPANIELARTRFAEGNTADARELLQPIISRVKNEEITPEALMLLAEIERAAGNSAQTMELLNRARTEFPTAPLQPKAAVAYARLLEEEGREVEALEIYREVSDSASPTLRAPAVFVLGREAEKAGDVLEARRLYHQAAHEAEWDSETTKASLDALGRLNVDRIFSPEPAPESEWYVVQPGDSLVRIGVKLNTTQGLLMRANGIENPNLLRPQQRLKYTPKNFRIVIERSKCRLLLLDDNGIFKRYPTGLGQVRTPTAIGEFTIGSKEKDPTWHKPGSPPVPPGDPENELGTRWMPMVPLREDLPTDLGIHGTIDPASIGLYSSKGCPRMYREDVEELYDLVVRATHVTVCETFDFANLDYVPLQGRS